MQHYLLTKYNRFLGLFVLVVVSDCVYWVKHALSKMYVTNHSEFSFLMKQGMLLGDLLEGGTDRFKQLSRCRVALISLSHHIMAVMVSRAFSSLVCVLCVILLPAESGKFYFVFFQQG